MIETGISNFIPLGKLGLQHRYNYLNKTVPSQLEKMLSTGLDSKGNKLSPEDITSLKTSLEKVKAGGDYKPGMVNGANKLGEGLKKLAQKVFPKESEKKKTSTSSTSAKPSASSKPKPNPSNTNKKKLSEGGFITRR